MKFYWSLFFAGLAVGLVYIYVAPPPRVDVVVHPDPFNAGRVVYERDDGTCFVYEPKKCEA